MVRVNEMSSECVCVCVCGEGCLSFSRIDYRIDKDQQRRIVFQQGKGSRSHDHICRSHDSLSPSLPPIRRSVCKDLCKENETAIISLCAPIMISNDILCLCVCAFVLFFSTRLFIFICSKLQVHFLKSLFILHDCFVNTIPPSGNECD